MRDGVIYRNDAEINKDAMMNLLLEACPSFGPKWQAFLDEWKDEPEEMPLYIALGDYARQLIRMLGRSETDGFPKVFHTIERLLCQGDHYVRQAIAVGLLEGLQNSILTSKSQTKQLRQYLGPESKGSWDRLIRFWKGESQA